MTRSPKAAAPVPAALDRIAEPRVGVIVSAAEVLRVDYPGNRAGPRPARALAQVAPASLAADAQVLLLFENGDPGLPIVVGVLPSATPHLDAVLDARPGEPVEARVDGTTVVLEGRDEVVLRCGKASIALHRDGRVEVRGVNVKTEARQVNRIRGGKVEIN